MLTYDPAMWFALGGVIVGALMAAAIMGAPR